MNIKTLFETYTVLVSNREGSESIFSKSGMLNIYDKLDYGFFPLGSGILTDKSEIKKASIPSNGTMVLGNDFGTLNYFETKCCKTNREESSKTIRNLGNIGLELEKTFFTNFYLGLRNDKLFNGTTNTKRIKQIEQDYKELCYNFFQVQLEMIEPKIVLCLGAEVGKILSEFSPEVFSKFSMKKNNISALFADSTKQDYIIDTDDSVFGKKRFILIPHPSYAHINWKQHDIKSKIEKALLT